MAGLRGRAANYRLSDEFIEDLRQQKILELADTAAPKQNSMCQHGWKVLKTLGLDGHKTEQWTSFIQKFQSYYIRLSLEDVLIWSKIPAFGVIPQVWVILPISWDLSKVKNAGGESRCGN